MRWSFKIGRLFGIGLYVHFTFLLLLAFFGYAAYSVSGSVELAAAEVGFILILFGIVTLHELGHALAAKYYGIPTRDITLLPIGGVARLERIPRDPVKELVIAIAGPAVNVVLAILCFGVLWGVYGTGPWGLSEMVGGDLWNRLFWINVILVIFNMIPAYPMDGGRVLRALLALTMDHSKATRIATVVGQAMALVIGVVGFMWLQNPMLVLIALFVWMGAAQEGAVARARSGLAGATVRRALVTRFDTLAPNDSFGWALQQSLHGGQKDFPVLEEGRLVGMLTRMDLRDGIDRHGFEAPVYAAMRPAPRTLTPGDGLEAAMEGMEENRVPALPVMHEDHLLGLVTVESIQEFLAVRHMLPDRPQASGTGWFTPRRDEGAWSR